MDSKNIFGKIFLIILYIYGGGTTFFCFYYSYLFAIKYSFSELFFSGFPASIFYSFFWPYYVFTGSSPSYIWSVILVAKVLSILQEARLFISDPW